jgi:hypothetical protein
MSVDFWAFLIVIVTLAVAFFYALSLAAGRINDHETRLIALESRSKAPFAATFAAGVLKMAPAAAPSTGPQSPAERSNPKKDLAVDGDVEANKRMPLWEIAYQLAAHFEWERARDLELKAKDEADDEQRAETQAEVVAMRQAYEKLVAYLIPQPTWKPGLVVPMPPEAPDATASTGPHSPAERSNPL